ncbi:hypothetical protein CXF85_12755 [Colwellia sp. 75C3]|uniref:hypothetical protein n=1 Tax=Colwellia sp. 75C3 TaxID=888425 RepID=UPI000C33DDA6|nr:hypothetical protein [Colwellia sp. 75C3]PKG82356.1 hypothetical protein CXF85_12755 [Colwellia sp. 75C3]
MGIVLFNLWFGIAVLLLTLIAFYYHLKNVRKARELSEANVILNDKIERLSMGDIDYQLLIFQGYIDGLAAFTTFNKNYSLSLFELTSNFQHALEVAVSTFDGEIVSQSSSKASNVESFLKNNLYSEFIYESEIHYHLEELNHQVLNKFSQLYVMDNKEGSAKDNANASACLATSWQQDSCILELDIYNDNGRRKKIKATALVLKLKKHALLLMVPERKGITVPKLIK